MTNFIVGAPPPLVDEIEFWAHQSSEHALFMQLGLTDPTLKANAEKLHGRWESFRVGERRIEDALALALETRALQLDIHDRLTRGQWLGWLFPTFIDHIRREGDYFITKLTGQPLSASDECRAWHRFMAEHAAFAAHLLDPTEAAQIQAALLYEDEFSRLEHACASAMNEQLVMLSEQRGRELDAYFTGLGIGKQGGAKSIIHPLLAEHVVREGRRFLATMRQSGLRFRSETIQRMNNEVGASPAFARARICTAGATGCVTEW